MASTTHRNSKCRFPTTENARPSRVLHPAHEPLPRSRRGNDISFIERALPSRTFNDIAGGSDGRRLGVGLNTFGHNVWTASAGIFGRNAAGETGTDDESDPIAFVGRLTLSHWHTENRAFHLGFAGSWLSPGGTHTVQIRSRPEARVGADRLVDTGGLDASDVNRYGVEAAGVYGPFSLQGEYLRGDVNREDAGSPDVGFDGWYVTGESRGYVFEEARFKNPKPKGIVGKGASGPGSSWRATAPST